MHTDGTFRCKVSIAHVLQRRSTAVAHRSFNHQSEFAAEIEIGRPNGRIVADPEGVSS